jgi:hypothetical protein
MALTDTRRMANYQTSPALPRDRRRDQMQIVERRGRLMFATQIGSPALNYRFEYTTVLSLLKRHGQKTYQLQNRVHAFSSTTCTKLREKQLRPS